MFDMEKLNSLLGDFQQKAKEAQEKDKQTIYTAKSGGGLLRVDVNGGGEVVDIEIDPSLLEDKDSLQILLISAINEAYAQVQDAKQKNAMGMLGNLNLFGQ
ncbi:nucleoid-associated protein [Helicobacter enhydrae]|uniref:Nucleoid-associated protein BBW65_00290 n=1 Tax=Helicobacter enhydrae TaxID=222136 RepID=A0A1B1U3P6_9HELI|nr:YbaB/EbfC family nucleoid-associated protein [Helicobacter enhydrae]ANV97352.1 nucleoid-associated protein [Helicobacter enhydrae]